MFSISHACKGVTHIDGNQYSPAEPPKRFAVIPRSYFPKALIVPVAELIMLCGVQNSEIELSAPKSKGNTLQLKTQSKILAP